MCWLKDSDFSYFLAIKKCLFSAQREPPSISVPGIQQPFRYLLVKLCGEWKYELCDSVY